MKITLSKQQHQIYKHQQLNLLNKIKDLLQRYEISKSNLDIYYYLNHDFQITRNQMFSNYSLNL